MSGGQHRIDEVNGPSPLGEREPIEVTEPAKQASAASQEMGCAQEKQKGRKTFLTRPTSLEMFPTVIWQSFAIVLPFL